VVEKRQEGLTRRDFLTGAAAIGAGTAGGLALGGVGTALAGTASTDDWMPAAWDDSADVVIIGYGFAGQATAIEAAKAGASVLILEKMQFKERGGNSRVCGQGMLAPDSDIWTAYESYIKEATEGQGFPTTHCAGVTSDDTIKFYVEQSAKNRDWFSNLGYPLISANNGPGPGTWIPFFPTFPGAAQIATEPQFWTTDTATPGAHTGPGKVWYNLEDYIAKQSNIRIKYKSPAKRLVQNPTTKEVLGVVVTQDGKEKFIKASKAVAVCGGGYEFNHEMTKAFQGKDFLFTQGAPSNTGETILMAAAAGAALRNMTVVAAPTYLSAGIFPQYKGAIPLVNYLGAGGFILVGANNKRFKDEYRQAITGYQNLAIADREGTLTYSGQQIQNGVYVRQPMPEPCHFIFDETARLSGQLFGSSMSWVDNVEGYKASSDSSAELANGWVIQADTIAELATKIGRDPDELEATVTKWNTDCANGVDEFNEGIYAATSTTGTYQPYARPASRLVPLAASGPYYAVQVYQCTLNTQGGMVRNLNSEVMSTDDKPIPRLYAAGENGDIWTILYQCMSNVGGGCFGYGRVAGQQAAALAPWDSTSSSTLKSLFSSAKSKKKSVKSKTKKAAAKK
jgi:succinate dehydrogenase/fumarate reductase flavoprotein subunit